MGDAKTFAYAESAHWVGKLAVRYPLAGRLIDGVTVNVYSDKADICNVAGSPLQVILEGYTVIEAAPILYKVPSVIYRLMSKF